MIKPWGVRALGIVLLCTTACVAGHPPGPSALGQSGHDPLDLNEPLEPLELAITIDDLPAQGELPEGMSRLEIAKQIVAALHGQHVPPVYGFSTGEAQTPQGREVLKVWLDAGHPLGNHTLSHTDLTYVTAEAFIADIAAMQPVLEWFAPHGHAWHLFRYPFLNEGDTIEKRNQVRQYLQQNGYQIAHVTIDYTDWAWNEAYVRCAAAHDAQMVRWISEHVVKAARRHVRRAQKIARLVTGRDMKHILLLHINALNALTLPEMLAALEADGVQFIDLETALRDQVYQINPNQPTPEGRTFLEQLVEMKDVDNPYEEQVYTVERLKSLCHR